MRSYSRRFNDPVRAFFDRITMGNDCWEWTAGTDRHGYGRLTVRGKRIQSHRFSYEFFVGPAGDLFVLHSCDNPPCVRPDHLRLGTHAENMADMKARGRAYRRPSPALCPAGHDDWVITYPKNRAFVRECRTCRRAQKRRSYAKTKKGK